MAEISYRRHRFSPVIIQLRSLGIDITDLEGDQLLEVLNQGEEFAALGLGGCILYIFCIFQILSQDGISCCGPLAVASREVVDSGQ
jgi:hypothetical protein